MKRKIDNSTTEAEKRAIARTLDDFARGVVTFNTGSIRDRLSAIHSLIDVKGTSSFYHKDNVLALLLKNFNVSVPKIESPLAVSI